MKKIAFVSLGLLIFAACGPGYLTPDQVRAHLMLPQGSVVPEGMTRASEGFFMAQRASEAENQALFFKDDGAATAAFAGSMLDGVSTNAATAGDVICAAGLIAGLSRFDACTNDQDCEVTVVVDSCVLRVAGDDNARGKLRFNFKNEVEPEFRQATLTLEFEALEFGQAGVSVFFAGAVAIEFLEIGDEHLEVILTTDLDFQVRGFNRGFFNDDIIERVRITVALRFTADQGDDFAAGTLEILAFVDENGERTKSVVISFSAEARQIDNDTALAGATLSVRGHNGAFECTWAAASQNHSVTTSTYESSGSCVDLVTGETFDWDNRVERDQS